MHSIVSSDILPLDIVIRIPDPIRFMAIVKKYGLAADGKTPIAEDMFYQIAKDMFIDDDFRIPSQQLIDLTEGRGVVFSPGGSSATTLITAAKLGMKAEFIGITGDDRLGCMVRQSFRDAGILLLPERLPAHLTPQTSVSFSFIHTDTEGKEHTSYAVYRGNAARILTPEIFERDIIDRADGVFWQASMLDKFHPDISNRHILRLRWELGKKLLLAPHTSESSARASTRYMQYLLPRADGVFGSIKEWSWTLFPDVKTEDIRPEPVLNALQNVFKAGFLARAGRLADRDHVGFISHGKEGAYAITPDGIDHVPAGVVAEIESAGGAGDILAGGAKYAYYKAGLDPVDALCVGVELAAAKIETTINPRLDNPHQELQRRNPELYACLMSGGDTRRFMDRSSFSRLAVASA
jgi:sugar/nucleoside kinase (ribokinase family)